MTEIIQQFSILSIIVKYLSSRDLCNFVLVNQGFRDVGQIMLNQKTLSKWQQMSKILENVNITNGLKSDSFSYFISRLGIFLLYKRLDNVGFDVYMRTVFGDSYFHYVFIDIKLNSFVELFSHFIIIPKIFSQRHRSSYILEIECDNQIVYVDLDFDYNLKNHIKPEYHIADKTDDFVFVKRFQNLFLPPQLSFSFLCDLKRKIGLSDDDEREANFVHSCHEISFEEEQDHFFITNDQSLMCFHNHQKQFTLNHSEIIGRDSCDKFIYLGNDFILYTTKDTMFFYKYLSELGIFELIKSIKTEDTDCVYDGKWIHKLKFCLAMLDNQFIDRYLLIDLAKDVYQKSELYQFVGSAFSFEKECFIYDKDLKKFMFYYVPLGDNSIKVHPIDLFSV
jgi:hypothetical protein